MRDKVFILISLFFTALLFANKAENIPAHKSAKQILFIKEGTIVFNVEKIIIPETQLTKRVSEKQKKNQHTSKTSKEKKKDTIINPIKTYYSPVLPKSLIGTGLYKSLVTSLNNHNNPIKKKTVAHLYSHSEKHLIPDVEIRCFTYEPYQNYDKDFTSISRVRPPPSLSTKFIPT